jgi:TrmH family RNA methyltransferase
MPKAPKHLSSNANPTIKFVQQLLRKSSERRSSQLCVVEGEKEILSALKGGFKLHSLYVCPELYGKELPPVPHEYGLFTLTAQLFAKLAYRDRSDGLLAVVHTKTYSLDQIHSAGMPFLLVAEAVEKPGNLGALLRVADGSGADAVVICDEHTDVFNPNAIRASVGTIFRKPVVVCSNQEFLKFCQAHHINRYTAALTDSALPYTGQDYTHSTAIIVGTEADGLSDFWLSPTAATPVILPMNGHNDSLNVSVAAAVLAYEVVRQRA